MSEPAGRKCATRLGKSRLYGVRVVVIMVGLGCLALIVLPFLSRVRTGPSPCCANLNRIGTACLVYAQTHGGALPPDLETLTLGRRPLLAPHQLVCPQSGGQYIYIGAGQFNWNDPRNVIAYEPAANHGGRGAAMLRLDGSCKWQDRQTIVDELAATRNRIAFASAGPPAPDGIQHPDQEGRP